MLYAELYNNTLNFSTICRHLTSVPHVAGTVRDREQAEWLRDRFLESGLDEAKTVPYEVLLSYPRSDGVVNRVSLIDGQGNVQFETVGRQTPLGSPEEFSDEVQVNFNAYSGSGVVEVIRNTPFSLIPFDLNGARLNKNLNSVSI
jgi:hypothetical protein